MDRSPLIPPSPTADDYARGAGGSAQAPAPLTADDPFALFGAWLAEAGEREPNDANAMSLATAGVDGAPDVRVVLLKDFDAAGFVFYTHFGSAKGRQLAANPQAALGFHWKSLRRQVRVRGPVSRVSDAEANDYFESRSPQARTASAASDQSQPLDSRATLERRAAELGARVGPEGAPRPAGWGGYRLVPAEIEFWRDGPFRLHDRLLFTREGEGWRQRLLYP